MRIALVTEQFSPGTDPSAHLTREVVAQLVDGGHEVVVFAQGRGQASFRGARVFWASRMTPISSIREALALSRPDVCHLIDPHRLGIKVADAAERLDLPTVVLDPRSWRPGVDLEGHHPGLRDPALHEHWARVNSLDGGRLVVGYLGDLHRTKVLHRLQSVARLPGVRLVVLGDGHGAEALREAGAKVLPRPTGVERARCLASLDVLLQPRKKEGYAPAVHEALASGVPVVAYDGGTAADVVRHGHNGLLVGTDRGARAVRSAVTRLAEDRALHADLAARARESVLDRTWGHAVTELLEVHYPAAVGRLSVATG
jgi:glycosyltransferase involved in cell wall biosynthesis